MTYIENVSVNVIATHTKQHQDGTIETASEPICSGFSVASAGTFEIIVTADHCIDLSEPVTEIDDTVSNIVTIPTSVQFFDGDVAQVKHIWKFDADDVAVLEVQSMRKHPEVAQGTESFVRGDHFTTFGMPSGTMWALGEAFSMTGNIEEPTDQDGLAVKGIDIGAVGIEPGSSGGGVFDHTGKVVGMVDAVNHGYPTHAIMVSNTRIKHDLHIVGGEI